MALFGEQKSSDELKLFLKKVLKNQQTEIEKLRRDVGNLQDDNSKLKEKYEFVLETLLEKIGKGSDRFPIENSNRQISTSFQEIAPQIQMSDIQLLMLLENSKATNRTFAVSVNQLKTAFSIESSDRTLRNKLSSLEQRGYTSSFGSRPKFFFLTPSGMNLLQKQKRGVINFESNMEF